MCWLCNPMCGGCQPPRKRMVQCPECNHWNLIDLQVTSDPKTLLCENCSLDITIASIPEPRYCDRYEVTCANPCGYSTKLIETGDRGTCQFWKPVPVAAAC